MIGLLTLAMFQFSPEQQSQMANSLRLTGDFVNEQTDPAHARKVARQCQEALDLGSLAAGLPTIHAKYSMSPIYAKAFDHDCMIYELGKRSGG